MAYKCHSELTLSRAGKTTTTDTKSTKGELSGKGLYVQPLIPLP